jgi:hypothetical protein
VIAPSTKNARYVVASLLVKQTASVNILAASSNLSIPSLTFAVRAEFMRSTTESHPE